MLPAQIDFVVTRDDLAAFCRVVMRQRSNVRRLLMNFLLWLVPGLVLFVVGASFQRYPLAAMGFTFFIFMLVVRPIQLILWYALARWTMVPQAIRMSGKPEVILGPHTIVLSEDGLLQRSSSGENRLSWSAVFNVLETSRHVIFLTGEHLGQVVPRSAFASDEEAAAFAAQARMLMAGTRTTATA